MTTTPCGGIQKEKAKSDLSNKIPLPASFERSFYGLFLTKAALLPFLLNPASEQAASLLIKLAELHIYEEARKGPTLLLSSASAYEEELSKNDVFHSFIKFISSEKATKFCEIFTLLLTGTT